jgi:oligoribonuclease NrnB/cAMP/cGMP phosphodiesterase (DHH superfamily)
MFFEYLLSEGFFKDDIYLHALASFVEKVRRYDCWEWKEIYDDQEAVSLNQLMYLIGTDKFVERFVNRFLTQGVFSVIEGNWKQMFSEIDRVVIDMDNDKKEAYIQLKNKQMFRMPYGKHTVGVVFSEQYTSELGNVLSEMNEGLKFIVLIDMGGKKVSLRTIHDDIDLGKDVAKLFGGGGHAKASGFQFDAKHVVRLTDFIFQTGKLAKFLKIIDKLFKN